MMLVWMVGDAILVCHRIVRRRYQGLNRGPAHIQTLPFVCAPLKTQTQHVLEVGHLVPTTSFLNEISL